MMTTTMLWILAAAAWFGPVFLAGWMARHWLRKDGDKVVMVGLIFGLLGSAVAAMALPKLSDDEWEAKGKSEKQAVERSTEDYLLWGAASLCVLAAIAVAGIMMV